MTGRMTFSRGLALCAAWTIVAFMVLPMLVVVPVSFTDTYFLSMPQEQLSLQHYQNFFQNPRWLNAIWQSVLIALGATAIAVVLGTLCAIGCWRIASGMSDMVRLIMLAPIIVPQIVQALAFYRVWIDFGLLDSYTGVILAHSMIGLPYVVITVSAALSNFDVRLEQAARNLGASMAQTVALVILPRIWPGVASGAVFVFILSFDEIVTVLFITSRRIQTLPKMIWDGIQEHLDPTIAVVAVIFTVLVAIIVVIDQLLRARAAAVAARKP
ncbi:MAG: ABC transporter permease [Alkalilacustris sp.]